jgi:hypothetical protein
MMVVLFLSPLPSLVAADHNYTWSLLLFAVPSALILGWFAWTKEREFDPVKQAFWLTLALLVPMGVLLNLFFARSFFTYPNGTAVCGFYVPGLDLHTLTWARTIPIEEFAFYGFGFLTMLLVYLWADAFFLKREHVRAATYREQGRVLQFAIVPTVIALVVVGAGILFKQTHGGGFPGYLTFLMLLPFVVGLTLYRVARDLVNWPAFALMLLYILGLSVLWEASLALPGGWWNYQHAQMVGLYVARWSSLPIEAVLVWFLGAFTSAVVFEAAKVFVHHPAVGTADRLLTNPAAPPAPAAPTPVPATDGARE